MAEQSEALSTSGTAGIIGYRLRRAQFYVFQRFLAVFNTLELRPAEYSVLVLIADNPGRKQTEIAEVLGIKRANFVTLAHGLEERGLIERRAAPGDRRANALYLTRQGQAFLLKARSLHDSLETELVGQLGGEDERAVLIRLLERLR